MAQIITIFPLIFRIQAELWFPEIWRQNFEGALNAAALEGIAARVD